MYFSPQCYTTQGLELARVTVVNSSLQVIYDTFVQPENEVIDYNTRYTHQIGQIKWIFVCCVQKLNMEINILHGAQFEMAEFASVCTDSLVWVRRTWGALMSVWRTFKTHSWSSSVQTPSLLAMSWKMTSVPLKWVFTPLLKLVCWVKYKHVEKIDTVPALISCFFYQGMSKCDVVGIFASTKSACLVALTGATHSSCSTMWLWTLLWRFLTAWGPHTSLSCTV